MKRLPVFLSALLSLPFLTGAGDESAEEILRRVESMLLEHSSISYDIIFRQKYFSGDDTIRVDARCELIRAQEDTAFGGALWYRTADSLEIFYDYRTIYAFYRSQGEVVTFDPAKGETFVVNGNIAGNVIETGFLSPSLFTWFLKPENAVTLEGEEMIGDRACWKIRIVRPDTEESTDRVQYVWVEKETFLPIRRSFRVRFQGNYQYSEWLLSNIRFDSVDLEQMNERNRRAMEGYPVTAYKPRTEEERALLAEGSAAPDFSGIRYGDGTPVRLSEATAKLVVLDFWYMSCYPCMEALPHLDTLYRKYGGEGLQVWGVNSIDNNDKQKARFPKFFEYNPITYPVVLTQRTVDSLYNVTGYPTLYIVNEQGKVVYAQIGFGEPSVPEMEKVIRRELGIDD